MEELLWGAGYRMLTAVLRSAPTILCGLVVAAVLRRLMGGPLLRSLVTALVLSVMRCACVRALWR